MLERSAPDFDLVRARLSQVRKERKLDLRHVAEALGTSAATLSRFENRKGNLAIGTLWRLVEWLDLDRADVFNAPVTQPTDTPGFIEARIRADPKLDVRTAQALADGFRIMYERFTEQ